jgi:serine protease AprX
MRKMKIASLVACLVIASTSTGFALTKPTVQKVTPEYKIQRVAGSKIMSNLVNKTSEDKLPVIVTFNTMDAAKKFNKKYKRKYRHIPAVATEMTMAEVHELAKHPDVAQIDYDEQVKVMDDGSDYWYGTQKARTDFGMMQHRQPTRLHMMTMATAHTLLVLQRGKVWEMLPIKAWLQVLLW